MEPSSGTSSRDRRKRGNRRSTVSGAAPRIDNEIKTRKRSSSDVMRFPWSSSSPTAPLSPALPEDPDSTPTASPTASATTSSTAARTTSWTGQKRAIPGNVLAKLNIFRSSGAGAGGEDGKSPAREKEAGTSPTKSFFSAKSGEDEEILNSAEKDKSVSDAAGKSKTPFSRKSIEDDGPPTSPTSPEADRRESALSAAMRQVKTRKRKGSLRKTALLGGRRISLLQRPSSMKQVEEAILPDQEHIVGDDDLPLDNDEEVAESSTRKRSPTAIPLSSRRNFTYPSSIASTNSDGSAAEPPAATMARLSLLTDAQSMPPPSRTIANELGSPTEIKSPQSAGTNYTSPTTSDDDLLTFSRPTKSTTSQTNLTPLSTSPGSYFPPQPPISHSLSRHTTSSTSHGHNTRLSSPLSRTLPLSAYPDTKSKPSPLPTTTSPYPSTETEYWGYFILLCTWLTFTVGMGSCLEIWSWAWEVEDGRVKPHVPPELSELNDDETLPIVGYYPTLIVLTVGVVSWVWVTVAWVGMKYFRHAKVEV